MYAHIASILHARVRVRDREREARGGGRGGREGGGHESVESGSEQARAPADEIGGAAHQVPYTSLPHLLNKSDTATQTVLCPPYSAYGQLSRSQTSVLTKNLESYPTVW